MFTKIDVITAFGKTLTLPLEDTSGGYEVRDISGLDPVKATLVFSAFAGQDGSQYQSARRENRDITLKLGFAPNSIAGSAATLRRRLYQYLMPKSYIQIRFYEDNGQTVMVNGRVESFDSPRFVEEPDATIGIVCENPDFEEIEQILLPGSSTAGSGSIDHLYLGSVDTGVLFSLTIDKPTSVSSFTVYVTDEANVEQAMTVNFPLLINDRIVISTSAGQKYIVLVRDGVDSSILYAVSPTSNWFRLNPGINNIRVLMSGVSMPWQMLYNNKYGGL